MSPGKVFDTGEYMTTLCNLSIKDYNGSRVSFIKDWFEQLRLLNEFASAKNGMGHEFAKSLLLKAVNGDEHLPDAFTELVFTNNATIDLEAMKLHLFKKAALYDGRDNFLKGGNSKKNAISINLSERYHDASSEALSDIDTYAINRTATNPEARMPDDLFKAMEPRLRYLRPCEWY